MRRIVCIFMVLLAVIELCRAAHAHDSWISKQGLRSPKGEWCCGEGDCGVVLDPSNAITITPHGYHVRGMVRIDGTTETGTIFQGVDEDVPFSEAQPSPDGAYWRCKKPDGSRRCFFAPPPNT